VTTRQRRRLARAATVVTALVAASVPGRLLEAHAASPGRLDLPPPGRAALARLFDAKLAPLGLHTTRAALESSASYRANANGRHLAIYVEPTGEYSNARYVANIVPVARLFLPVVFDRWKDLHSFDVCQEPPQAVDSTPEPAPFTQVLVNRRGAHEVRWKHAQLADLLAASALIDRSKQNTRWFSVYVAPTLVTDRTYQAARANADAQKDAATG
jgi:hypothetical protein